MLTSARAGSAAYVTSQNELKRMDHKWKVYTLRTAVLRCISLNNMLNNMLNKRLGAGEQN